MLVDSEWENPREIDRLPTTDEIVKSLRLKAGTSPITITFLFVAAVAIVFVVVLEWLIALQTLFIIAAAVSGVVGIGNAVLRFITADVPTTYLF